MAASDHSTAHDAHEAPPVLRRLGRLALALLLASALALIVVRREAILVDLANFAAACF